MNKGIIAFIVLIAVVAVIGYFFLASAPHTATTTTTIKKTYTTIITNATASTTTIFNTTFYDCSNLQLASQVPYDTVQGECKWSGGELGLWVAGGNQGPGTVIIKGQNNITYINTGFSYNCTTFYETMNLPAQEYNVSLTTGSGDGTCGQSLVKLNLTYTPPRIAYNYVYNGNFSNGQYTGWNITGAGFGSAPLNLTSSSTSNVMCYLGQQWSGYSGDFAASTFDCGLGTAPGNITSSEFKVSGREPFLNFKLISPQDNFIYLEILEVNSSPTNASGLTPEIIAHFDTYNESVTNNASSTFLNASIPLSTLTNKIVVVKVVADTLRVHNYIAVGDFSLGGLPTQDAGVYSNITIVGH